MNIKAIRLFLHVMQRGSLVAAANELNTSPSAVSRLLAGLERETGLTLFSRDRQRLEPTAEGQQYFTECYCALAAIDEFAARCTALGKRCASQVETRRHAEVHNMPAASGRCAFCAGES